MSNVSPATSDDLFHPVHQVLTLSEQMLACALSEEWQHVISLENQRRRLIEEIDFGSAQENVPDEVRHMCEEILRLNEELAKLGNIELNRCMAEMKGISQGKKATKAYGGNT